MFQFLVWLEKTSINQIPTKSFMPLNWIREFWVMILSKNELKVILLRECHRTRCPLCLPGGDVMVSLSLGGCQELWWGWDSAVMPCTFHLDPFGTVTSLWGNCPGLSAGERKHWHLTCMRTGIPISLTIRKLKGLNRKATASHRHWSHWECTEQ